MSKKITYILASNSKARRKLFKKLGLPFQITSSDYEEDMNAHKSSVRLACFLSLEKAKAVAPRYLNAIIITADTFITVGRNKIGKPSSRAQAREIIQKMSGKIIKVITGVTVLRTDQAGQIKKTLTSHEITKLKIKKMSQKEIEILANQPNALQISGAFSIEGKGGEMIEWRKGSRDNVIGLPLNLVRNMLKRIWV
jgi:septum formation protein